MIYKRVEGLNDPFWPNHLKTVLNNYNNKHISRATGMMVDYQNTEQKLE